MRGHGVEVIDLDLPECVEMMPKFISENPRSNEDTGRQGSAGTPPIAGWDRPRE